MNNRTNPSKKTRINNKTRIGQQKNENILNNVVLPTSIDLDKNIRPIKKYIAINILWFILILTKQIYVKIITIKNVLTNFN